MYQLLFCCLLLLQNTLLERLSLYSDLGQTLLIIDFFLKVNYISLKEVDFTKQPVTVVNDVRVLL